MIKVLSLVLITGFSLLCNLYAEALHATYVDPETFERQYDPVHTDSIEDFDVNNYEEKAPEAEVLDEFATERDAHEMEYDPSHDPLKK